MTSTSAVTEPKAGTRQAEFFEHLKGAGASMETLVAAMGWQPHSVRAALTGLRKRGLNVERVTGDNGEASIYRVRTPTRRARSRK